SAAAALGAKGATGASAMGVGAAAGATGAGATAGGAAGGAPPMVPATPAAIPRPRAGGGAARAAAPPAPPLPQGRARRAAAGVLTIGSQTAIQKATSPGPSRAASTNTTAIRGGASGDGADEMSRRHRGFSPQQVAPASGAVPGAAEHPGAAASTATNAASPL